MKNRAVTHLLFQLQPLAYGCRCAGAAPACYLAERFAADESASGDMRRTYISELLDAGADLASVQKMVAHGGATAMAGYDRRGDATRRRAADLVHVPFSRGRPERAATESNAARTSCRKPAL
jgi:hypothetical protein